MTTTTTDTIRTKIDELVEKTGLTIELGYVGNVDRGRDDRLWHVWIYNARDHRPGRHGNLVSIGAHTTDRLDDLAELVTIERVRMALDVPTGFDGLRPCAVTDFAGVVVTTREESARLIDALVAGDVAYTDEPAR